jgi:DNA modification methylase
VEGFLMDEIEAVLRGERQWAVINADCLSLMPTLPDGRIGAVITDPPYPEIDRDYGRWTEAEWFVLMDAVVPQCRRALAPDGSAVFVLQPNSERVGRMRTWLWDFMAKWGREWGVVQDAYWWNYTAPPQECSNQRQGLLKPSLKACVWLGSPDCHRDQDAVLRLPSAFTLSQMGATISNARIEHPSGHGFNKARIVRQVLERNGSAPLNLLPVSNARGHTTAGGLGHGAGTPRALCDWWVRYLSRRGDVVLDPFCGTATVGHAAISAGRRFIGFERVPEYATLARRRLEEGSGQTGLFAPLSKQPDLFAPAPEDVP